MAKTYTTSQVVRHLERQPDLVFEAPETEKLAFRSVFMDRDGRVVVMTTFEVECRLPHRSDWCLTSGTIRKPRRRIKLGTIDLGNTMKGTPDLTLPRTMALSDDICEALRRTGKRWKIVAVEVI